MNANKSLIDFEVTSRVLSVYLKFNPKAFRKRNFAYQSNICNAADTIRRQIILDVAENSRADFGRCSSMSKSLP